MRKITVFLMLVCLVCVLPGCDNPTSEKKETYRIQEFTGTLSESLWDDELEAWSLGFDTGGDNDFVLKVEVGFTKEGVSIWFEPKNTIYAIDKENNEVGILIFPSEETPVVRMGFDYKITFTY